MKSFKEYLAEADSHEGRLHKAGFIRSTSYGSHHKGGEEHSFSHTSGENSSIGFHHASRYLSKHGYTHTHTTSSVDEKPFRGAKHEHVTHHYDHPSGKKATISVLHRLGADRKPTLSFTRIHGDHIKHEDHMKESLEMHEAYLGSWSHRQAMKRNSKQRVEDEKERAAGKESFGAKLRAQERERRQAHQKARDDAGH